MAGSIEDWPTESLLDARQAHQDHATGQRIKPGTQLADAYYDASLPVAKRRLDQAGVRLAMVLNEFFPPINTRRGLDYVHSQGNSAGGSVVQ
jgi:hypothetical protein